MDQYEPLNPDETPGQPLAADARPVCPNCLEPCDPRQNYCPHCGSNEAMNPLASYLPFVNIRFWTGMYGKLWHKTWAPDTPLHLRIVYLLLFLYFCPILLLVGIPVLIYEKFKTQKQLPPAPETKHEEASTE